MESPGQNLRQFPAFQESAKGWWGEAAGRSRGGDDMQVLTEHHPEALREPGMRQGWSRARPRLRGWAPWGAPGGRSRDAPGVSPPAPPQQGQRCRQRCHQRVPPALGAAPGRPRERECPRGPRYRDGRVRGSSPSQREGRQGKNSCRKEARMFFAKL